MSNRSQHRIVFNISVNHNNNFQKFLKAGTKAKKRSGAKNLSSVLKKISILPVEYHRRNLVPTEDKAEVKLQALVNHKAQRVFSLCSDAAAILLNCRLYFPLALKKWLSPISFLGRKSCSSQRKV